MKAPKPRHLSKQDLARRWGGITYRSVERIIKRFQLRPCGYFGRQPEFSPEAVDEMDERRSAARRKFLAQQQPGARIITVKAAKAAARRRAKKYTPIDREEAGR